MTEMKIPSRLSETAQLRHGERARSWIAALPSIVQRVQEEWGLSVGDPFDPSGTTAWTAPVLRNKVDPAVLKVHLSEEAAVQEASGLKRWDGNGSVKLLDSSPGVLLLEQCVPGTRLDALGDFEAEDVVAASLLKRLHARPASADIPTLADVMANRATATTERFRRLGLPVAEAVVARAAEILQSLADGNVTLHGDFQPENVVRAQRETYLAIDPAPMIGDPAYDGVQYLLFRSGNLADRRREWGHHIRRFAGLLEVDSDRLRRWMFAKLVHDGLWGADLGDQNWKHHVDVAQLVWELRM